MRTPADDPPPADSGASGPVPPARVAAQEPATGSPKSGGVTHRLVAAGALVLHLMFVGFALVGGFLAWLAPWVLLPHIAAALWGGRMAASDAACPLSRAEDWGREGAGKPRLHERGFIAHYFEGRFYPKGWGRIVQVLAGTVVIGSWLGLATR